MCPDVLVNCVGTAPASPFPTFSEILSRAQLHVEHLDIATINLISAQGLHGAEDLNIASCLSILDQWTEIVRRFVNDAISQWHQSPAEFNDQKGFHHFLAMATILKHPQGLGVEYQPTAIGNYDFADSRDDFLHGILLRRKGTCVSLPVLFVAIGRRLGWPIHIACSKGHFFCQWLNEDGSKINLEGSCAGGADMLSDDHFRQFPRPLNAADEASGIYLRPMTRLEELGSFLEARGHCLYDNKRFAEAEESYRQALRFSPKSAPSIEYLRRIREQQETLTKSAWTLTSMPVFPQDLT